MKRLIGIGLLLLTMTVQLSWADTVEDELFATAQRAFDDGFHDVAIKYLEEFVPKFPESKKINQARILLGQCYFLKNDYDKALSTLEMANSAVEEQDMLLFWRGEAQLKLGQDKEAREEYEQLMKRFPTSIYVPQALYSMAWSYFQDKEYAKAQAVFTDLWTRFPKHQLAEDAFLKVAQSYYNEGDYAASAKSFDQFIMNYPQSPHIAEAYLNAADSYYYAENFDKAFDLYEKAAKQNQEAKQIQAALVGKIWCLIKKKMYDQAQKSVKETIDFAKQKNISWEDVQLVMGQLAYEKGDYAAAVKAYQDMIKDYPAGERRLEAYLGMANAHYMLKAYADAAAAFKFIVERRQANTDDELIEKAMLGYAWACIKNNMFDDGLSSFRQVIAQSKAEEPKINALVQMADALQDIGRFKEAITAYEQVMSDFQRNYLTDYILYREAVAYLKLDQVQASLNTFERLKNNFPTSKYLEDIAYYRGLLAFKKSDWSTAAQSMGQFLKQLARPSDLAPEANYILGLALLNLKQADEALKIFQKILRLYPNDEAVAKNSDIGIAKCQFELGQVKEALKRFKLIVFKYPKSDVEEEALLWLAQYAMKNAQYDQAIEAYATLIDHFPESPQLNQVHYELGQAYELQGQSEAALGQYKLINAKDETLMAKVKLSIAGIFAKEFDLAKAITAYQSIVDTNPDYARDTYLKMAQLHRNVQNYDDEIKVYENALKAQQAKSAVTTAELFFNLGDTYEVMNQMEAAVDNYLKIPIQCPDQTTWIVKAYLRVAKIFEDRKDIEGAMVTYQKIIQLNTDESKYAQERLEALKKK